MNMTDAVSIPYKSLLGKFQFGRLLFHFDEP